MTDRIRVVLMALVVVAIALGTGSYLVQANALYVAEDAPAEACAHTDGGCGSVQQASAAASCPVTGATSNAATAGTSCCKSGKAASASTVQTAATK